MVKTENIFEFLVMYHPKEEYEISYEDTTEIDFNKPKTAEEVGRKLLKLNQLDNVEIENHYHTRTFPAPDGSDVNTVSFKLKLLIPLGTLGLVIPIVVVVISHGKHLFLSVFRTTLKSDE